MTSATHSTSHSLTPNQRAAERCTESLRRYADGGGESRHEARLIGLLADARHWCDEHGHSFDRLDRSAFDFYLAELITELGRSS